MTGKINIESEYEYATLNRKIIAFGIDIVMVDSTVFNAVFCNTVFRIFLSEDGGINRQVGNTM